MKIIIMTVLTFLLAAVLVFGNLHWNSKMSEPTLTSDKTDTTKNSVSESDSEIDQEYYLKLANNWSKKAQNQLKNKLTNNESYKIILLGSNSISNDNHSLEESLKKTLYNKYENHVELESIIYDGTTADYIHEDKSASLFAKKPDMIIFEPFILNDNNVIPIPETISNITSIINVTTEALPDVSFILQPPNQIYDANLYPMQVDALQGYAKVQNLIYLNHWEAWPDGKDAAVNDYLNVNARPNESGYKLWSTFLSEYLISE